jgi:hypothetical protein
MKILVVGTPFQADYLKSRLESIFGTTFEISHRKSYRGNFRGFDFVIRVDKLDQDLFYGYCRKIQTKGRLSYQKANAVIDFEVLTAEEHPFWELAVSNFEKKSIEVTTNERIDFAKRFFKTASNFDEMQIGKDDFYYLKSKKKKAKTKSETDKDEVEERKEDNEADDKDEILPPQNSEPNIE